MVPILALNVAVWASMPAAAALNQELHPSPDSTMTVLAISIIELIVDSAGPFCHCSRAVLK